jgi:molybdopterin-guanine dinucleotide biosynthesis protein A
MLFRMPSTRSSRLGYVLAGGKSSRMGTNIDKALVQFEGQTLLERALAAVGEVCEGIRIVGDPAKFREYGNVLADIFPGCGPLGGIHAALVNSTAELNLMLAVDMPFVSGELLAFLFAEAEKTDAMITVPRVGKGYQPLCAIYGRDFAIVAESALRAGNYKVDAAFSSVSVRVIEEAELVAAGFPKQSFFNVNTPQDRLAAEAGDVISAP